MSEVENKEIDKELEKFNCICGSSISKKNKSSHLKSKKHLDHVAGTTGLDPKLASTIFKMADQIDEIAYAVSILLEDVDDDDLDDVEEGEEEEEPKEKPKLVRQNAIEEKQPEEKKD